MSSFSLPAVAFVAAGGGIGCAARYTLSCLIAAGPNWLATAIANTLGSLLLGFLYGLLDGIDGTLSPNLRHFLGVGMIGGFTTFSAFATQMVDMVERADPWAAATYGAASVAGCFLLAGAGLMAGRALSA